MSKKLSVRLYGKEVGLLERDIFNKIKFTYNEDNNFAISNSLPVSKKTFTDKECHPYFGGLLPESDSIRKYLSKIFGINSNDDFALLQAIGQDCAGAITFHNLEEPIKAEKYIKLEYTSLTDAKLEKYIEKLHVKPFFMQADNDVRVSLAGYEDKSAVIVIDGKVCLPKNSTPTTHILKSTNRDLDYKIINEYVCIKAAKKLNIDVPNIEIKNIGNIRYLLIERYDRKIKNNTVKKIHQETFYQALGALVINNKYQAAGKPNITKKHIFLNLLNDLLDITAVPAVSRSILMKRIIFNFIVGNNDFHGKNLSLLCKGDKPVLASAYDVSCIDAKNFSLLYKGDKTVLAPAYDVLCFQVYPGKELVLENCSISNKKFITEKVFENLCIDLKYSYKNFIKEFYHIAENLYKAVEEEKDFFNKQEQNFINKILEVVDKNSKLADYL